MVGAGVGIHDRLGRLEPPREFRGHRAPGHHRAIGDGLAAVGDDAVHCELEADAETGAVRAGAVRRVERERARLQLIDGGACFVPIVGTHAAINFAVPGHPRHLEGIRCCCTEGCFAADFTFSYGCEGIPHAEVQIADVAQVGVVAVHHPSVGTLTGGVVEVHGPFNCAQGLAFTPGDPLDYVVVNDVGKAVSDRPFRVRAIYLVEHG